MYRQIIKTICSVLWDEKKDYPDLVLAPKMANAAANGNDDLLLELFNYELMLPEQVHAHHLSGNQTFLEEAVSLIHSFSARVILAIPPWLHDREWREAHSHMRLIEALIEQAFHQHASNGDEQILLDQVPAPYRVEVPDALILFVPRSLIDSHRSGNWRNEWFHKHGTTIIEHDHSLNIPGFGLPRHQRDRAVTLVIQKQPTPLRFFKITEEIMEEAPLAVLQDLRELLKKPHGETRFGHVYLGELTPDYPTTFDFYSPATQRLRDSVKDLSQKVSLAEVADVIMGFMPTRHQEDRPEQVQRIRHITGRNILENGTFDLTRLRAWPDNREIQGIRYLQKGDICVQKHRSPYFQTFGAAVFPGHSEPIAFDQSVIVIRPKEWLEEEQRLVILAFLRSSVAKDLFIAKGDFIMMRPHVLREFPVPLADQDLINAIKGLTEARDAFAEWKSKLDLELCEIITNHDLKTSRLKVLSAGQLARQRYRAARQVEELDYRIRTQYPLPLAYLWRDWQVSSPDPYRSLRNILKAAEGFTCYFALIALVAGRFSKIRIGYIERISKRLSVHGGGTYFGDWFAILKEVGANQEFRQKQNEVPFCEVIEMMRSEDFERSLRLLKQTRNDDSHGRINPNAVSTSLLKELESALTLIYDSAGFVSDYGLFHIKHSRLDSIKGLTRYEYAELKGDNPLVLVHKGETRQTELEIDSLYLRDRSGHLHLFRPYLHYLECPECHLMSTFYLDTYPGRGPTVGLKSFERNSTRNEVLAEAFTWTGLLKNIT